MGAETMQKPDWIYPGAEVVVYRDDVRRDASVHFAVTKVLRVAGKGFTIEGESERIQLADLSTKRLGGTWGGWRYRVVPVGSEKHNELRAAKHRERVKSAAFAAANAWMAKRDDPAAVLAVVEAFTALCDELGKS